MDSSEDPNFDIIPPSPPRSVHDDFEHQSPLNIFEFSAGVNAITSPPFAAPHTPSYNGSYVNSPYSQHSELSFNGEELSFDLLDLDMVGLNEYEPSEYEGPNAGLGTGSSLLMFSPDADYQHYNAADPHRAKGSPFDHSSPSDNGDEQPYDNPSFTRTSSGFDTTTAAANNLSDNRGHSRASSVNHSPQHSPSPQPQSQDVTQSFGNISIHTPNWGTQPLPQLQPSPQKAQSPPRLLMPEGILDSAQSIVHHQRSRSLSDDDAMLSTAVPKINHPPEDPDQDAMGGPSFHFVPATPVSGAGDERQGVPFQHSLTTLVQGAELTPHPNINSGTSSPQVPSSQPSPSPSPGQAASRPTSRQPSPFRYEFPRHPTNVDETKGQQRQQPVQQVSSSQSPPSRGGSNANTNTQGGYTFPDMTTFLTGGGGAGQSIGQGLGAELAQRQHEQQQQQQLQQGRQRRSSHSPVGDSNTWNQSGFGGFDFSAQQHHQNPAQQQQQQQQQNSQQQQQRAQLDAFTFGGGGSSAQNGGGNNTGYLSPELGGGMLQRSVSDVGRGGHRISRSEDIRGGGLMTANNAGGFAQSHPQQPQTQTQTQTQPQSPYGHHQNSLSVGGGFEFHSQQFLHPNNQIGAAASASRRSLPPAGGASSSLANPNAGQSMGIGHFRRLSSGSRSERGAEVWNGGGASAQHLNVQRRVSPYPSPNASPRVKYQELEDEGGIGGVVASASANANAGLHYGPSALLGLGQGASSMTLGLPPTALGEPPSSAGFTEEVGITGRGAYSGHNRGGSGSAHGDGGSSHGGRDQSPTSVGAMDAQGNVITKQNVTTGRTANASIRRRKQDANFACTVPGCNSTFTRGFNLKGHLRSHYEQKPYKCHWPGCGKGFARQHDCKRHEQLHSNFRPFECEGCRKQFARMDALNRHLRSEAGAECAKVVERAREEGRGMGMGDEGDGGGGGGDVSMGMGGMEEHELVLPPQQQHHTRPGTRRRNTGGATAAAAAHLLADEEWMSVAV